MFYGKGIFDFCITGCVIKVDKIENFIGKCNGKIVVLKNTTPDVVLLFNEAVGFVCEYGGITCHLALLAREMSVPCVVGVSNITQIEDGVYIKVTSINTEGYINEINPI